MILNPMFLSDLDKIWKQKLGPNLWKLLWAASTRYPLQRDPPGTNLKRIRVIRSSSSRNQHLYYLWLFANDMWTNVSTTMRLNPPPLPTSHLSVNLRTTRIKKEEYTMTIHAGSRYTPYTLSKKKKMTVNGELIVRSVITVIKWELSETLI